VADEILDVVEASVNATSVGAGPLVIGTAVLQGHATDLLDLLAAASCAGVQFRPVTDKEEPGDF
jgi:hypothetical protein